MWAPFIASHAGSRCFPGRPSVLRSAHSLLWAFTLSVQVLLGTCVGLICIGLTHAESFDELANEQTVATPITLTVHARVHTCVRGVRVCMLAHTSCLCVRGAYAARARAPVHAGPG